MIALLEVREARAREDLESWLEMLREAEVQAEAARQRLEHARIAREEVALMFAEGTVPAREGDGASPARVVVEEPGRVVGAVPTGPVLREGYDARPPVWRTGLGGRCVVRGLQAGSWSTRWSHHLAVGVRHRVASMLEVDPVRRDIAKRARSVRTPAGAFSPCCANAGIARVMSGGRPGDGRLSGTAGGSVAAELLGSSVVRGRGPPHGSGLLR